MLAIVLTIAIGDTSGDYVSGRLFARVVADGYCTAEPITKPTFVPDPREDDRDWLPPWGRDWIRGWRDGQRRKCCEDIRRAQMTTFSSPKVIPPATRFDQPRSSVVGSGTMSVKAK